MRGFTLIELLVVISIIAVLIALILPAVQQAREAARRSKCQNNLKQIGLALQNYHDAHQVFPPGWVQEINDPGPSSWAWSVFILPYLDQANLYEKLGVANGTTAVPPATDPLAAQVLPSYICPSDPGPVVCSLYKSGPTSAEAYHKSNYPAVCGGVDGAKLQVGTLRYGNGMFGGNTSTTISSITDGTSNTFAVGERHLQNFWGAIWIRTTNSDGTALNPSAVTGICWGPSALLNQTISTGSFGSFHTAGGYFLFADGSVKFISDNLHIPTYENLAAIADGNVLGAF